MVFSKSTLALCVSSLIVASSYAKDISNITANSGVSTGANSDIQPVFEQSSSSTKTYLVSLVGEGALAQAMADNTLTREEASVQINDQQDDLIRELYSLDQNAIVGSRLRIVANQMYIKMSEGAAMQLQSNSTVSNIIAVDEDDAEFIDPEQTPYSKLVVNDDGGHTVVAVIGPGVDYTHATLGGEGTFEGYNRAYANLTNYWGGFPNDVVIGGFDFVSEQGGYDYNPLEYPVDFVSPYNTAMRYEGGIGTMAASLIRQAASDAKILAYKTNGITYSNRVSYESRGNFSWALEMAMDPNQDGDMSDSADILLINYDDSIGTFYREQETNTDHNNVQMALIRAVAATGSLVVVPAGDDDFFGYHNYYSLSYRGGVKEALTVGYSQKNDGVYSVAPHSPLGPTRGDSILKPDILASDRKVTGASAAGGTIMQEMDANEYLIAAKVAGTAAYIMENQPTLTNEEVKALIVNTGILDIENHYGVAQIGGGTINPLAAGKSYALMMEESTLLPSIHLGDQAIYDKAGFTRNIIIKNLTDDTQNYDAEIVINGDKLSNQAIDVVIPKHIVLAPNEVKSVSVSFNIDADKLPASPITKGREFTLENWDEMAINGFIKLNHERNPGASIHMPWLVLPHRAAPYVIDADTSSYTPIYDDQYYLDKGEEIPELPFDKDWQGESLYNMRFAHHQVELTNTANISQDLYAMPLIYNAENKPQELAGNHGHFIKSIAGGLYSEQSCDSNTKLSVAVRLFEPFELPMANHPDKMGSTLLRLNLYNQTNVALANGSNLELDARNREQGKLTQISILNNDDAVFASRYTDLSMKYDVFDPLARFKETSLSLVISPGGDMFIINICTDVMYHGEINHTTFEEPIAMQFVTDRQALPGIDDPIFMHNFSTNGEVKNVVIADENDQEPVDDSCIDGYSKDSNNNCLRLFPAPVTMSVYDYFYDGFLDFNDKVKFERSKYNHSCEVAELGLKQCSLQHPNFTTEITLSVPEDLEFDGEIICDFPANDWLASCLANGISEIDGIDINGFITDVDFFHLLKEAQLEEYEAYSYHTGAVVKIANVNDSTSEQLQWQDKLTVPANGRVKVSFYSDNRCQSGYSQDDCLPGIAVFNPSTSFFAIGNGAGNPAHIKPEQSFSVPENAKNGQIIGRVQLLEDSLSKLKNQRILLIDGGQGAPFQLSADGILSVRDETMLDYERNKTYQLMVASNWGKVWGKQIPLTVGVSNVNDNAPIQLSNFGSISAKQQQQMAAIDLSTYYSDADNQGLIFTAKDLPLGLSLSRSGTLSGTPANKGQYSSTINVTDGTFSVDGELSFEISAAESKAKDTSVEPSAGSMFISLCMLLMLVRRRYC